ncbi:MAG TPA: hypothetical protein VGG16_30360 [Streptosporangiaceae bacterium]|jgi:hypothetical protein
MDGENPAETRPAGVVPVTGNERVEAVIAGLAELSELPVDQHPEVLERTNRRLGEILGEVESGDDPSPA